MSPPPIPELSPMRRLLLAITIVASLAPARSPAEEPYDIEWIQQIGTFRHDEAYDVTVDHTGSVYITGHSRGSLGGPNPQSDGSDALLAKFNQHGDLVWIEQSGRSGPDASNGISLDGLGNLYITGYTGRDDSDPRHFLTKYTDDGEFLWSTQDLTPINATTLSLGVSADGLGSVYVSGFTGSYSNVYTSSTAYLAKYDEAGALLWTREFGNEFAASGGVFADGLGNVYTTGGDGTGLDDYQAFLSNYNADGELLWTRDLGDLGISAVSEADQVVGDGMGNVYITGNTDVAGDILLAKFDAAGNLLWHDEFGTDQSELGYSVTADHEGNAYVAGWTRGSLGGPNAGDWDAFVTKYNPVGDRLWTQQFGTNLRDHAWGISADAFGNLYVAGATLGSLGGTNAGGADAFLIKLTPPLAPSLPGDYNNNGLVEQADLDLVLLNWGSELIDPAAAGWLADLPTGAIDQEELDKVLLGWGNSAAAVVATGAVPEPSALLVALAAICIAWLQRRRTAAMRA